MKIDTTQIPNFDALPDDAKAAISAMEFADAPDMSLFVEKSVFDKKAAEAGELGRQLKAKMTADEQAEAERTAREAEREARIAELEKREVIRTYEVAYLAMGYDGDLAKETAKALADGDTDKVFANQKKAAEAAEKKLKAELMRNNPHPGGAGGGNNDKEPDNIALAKKLGGRRKQAQSASDDIMKHYMK